MGLSRHIKKQDKPPKGKPKQSKPSLDALLTLVRQVTENEIKRQKGEQVIEPPTEVYQRLKALLEDAIDGKDIIKDTHGLDRDTVLGILNSNEFSAYLSARKKAYGMVSVEPDEEDVPEPSKPVSPQQEAYDALKRLQDQLMSLVDRSPSTLPELAPAIRQVAEAIIKHADRLPKQSDFKIVIKVVKPNVAEAQG